METQDFLGAIVVKYDESAELDGFVLSLKKRRYSICDIYFFYLVGNLFLQWLEFIFHEFNIGLAFISVYTA